MAMASPTRPRLKMLAEALPIFKAMWTEAYATCRDVLPGAGGHQRAEGGAEAPPPLWIGGGGEQVTLKLVAQYGDYSNFGGLNLEEFTRKAAILRQHCERVGRDYHAITKSAGGDVYVLGANQPPPAGAIARAFGNTCTLEAYRRDNFMGTAEELIERLGRMVEAGVQYFVLYVPGAAYDLEPLQRLAEDVVAKMRD